MAAKSPAIDADTIEREIVARLRAAKLRLRFDKVALRLVGRLKAALASVVPEGEAVIFTISAPIRLPGETAAALETMARSGSQEALRREVVHGAAVRIRRLEGAAKPMPCAGFRAQRPVGRRGHPGLGGGAAAPAERGKVTFRDAEASSAPALEKLLHLGEEAGAFGVSRIRGFGGELHQELALAAREVLRRLDIELDEQIARNRASAASACPCRAACKLAPRLAPSGTLTFDSVPSSVRTVNSPPSEACTIEIGTRQ